MTTESTKTQNVQFWFLSGDKLIKLKNVQDSVNIRPRDVISGD
jgi:hypothetical protein